MSEPLKPPEKQPAPIELPRPDRRPEDKLPEDREDGREAFDTLLDRVSKPKKS